MNSRTPSTPTLLALQAGKFSRLVTALCDGNPFYRSKLERAGWSSSHMPTFSDLSALPFTTKDELVEDQARQPPWGSNLGAPAASYTRIHRTSGTTGSPLIWLDTAESWQWWLDCWQEVYAAAGICARDRVLVAFSFGPFIGFWAAFEAAQQMGALVVPGGGLTTHQRLALLDDLGVTVLICTPTYALRLAQVAAAEGRALADGTVRITLLAGEPGASLPNVKARIESDWGARCFDHGGATEVGAWGYGCGVADHMHINEHEFIAEVIDAESQALQPTGTPDVHGELVLTNLGRTGSPVLRYRTGDLVTLSRSECACGRETAFLRGGIRGRCDGMIVVRGVNIFPGAVENIVRSFPAIVEFEARIEEERGMHELVISIEVDGADEAVIVSQLSRKLREQVGLRAIVRTVASGQLPRYELKSRRFKMFDPV